MAIEKPKDAKIYLFEVDELEEFGIDQEWKSLSKWDIIYWYITAEQFSPEWLLDCLDLSSEHHTLEVANRIEAAIHVWRLKDRKKHPDHQKSKWKSWGGKVKGLVNMVVEKKIVYIL